MKNKKQIMKNEKQKTEKVKENVKTSKTKTV